MLTRQVLNGIWAPSQAPGARTSQRLWPWMGGALAALQGASERAGVQVLDSQVRPRAGASAQDLPWLVVGTTG